MPGNLKLGRLIVLWDDNSITIDGSTELSRNEDVVARHKAAQWHTSECDGLNADDVSRAIEEALADPRPSLIRCRTIIGYGAPNKQGTAATHGAALGKDEVEAARQELGLEPRISRFPTTCSTAWRAAGKRGAVEHALVERPAGAERPQGRVPGAAQRQGRATPGSSPISTSCSPT